MLDYCNKEMSKIEYLDALVDFYNLRNKLQRYDENITMCGVHNCIQVNGGIVELSKAAEKELTISFFQDNLLEFHFEYKGVKFMELGNSKNWEEHKIVGM